VSFARAALQIVRPYSSLLTFLSILIPVFTRTNDFNLSLRRSIPLLFISMCTFIANDLDDIEKDTINHPDRPLPSGELTPTVAAIAYFVSLVLALFATRFGIGSTRISFLYYLLLTACISYTYVVEYLAVIKPVYVAGTSVLPVLILIAYFPHETTLYRVAMALFLFMLGRELFKDLLDRAGDPKSALHSIAPRHVAIFAFAIQWIGLLLMTPRAQSVVAAVDLAAMSALLVTAGFYWFRLKRVASALAVMKAVIFLGLYFLL
jgi:geranylgeranylglycerol-phosphate geranylgeranyltransferase